MATAPDVTTALDATGRRFAFRPAAITGNGSVLVTISERGEVERIFWPNVDHGQHLGELRLGLERQDEPLWLDDGPCTWEQTYLDGSSVLRTTAEIAGTTVEITDLVTPAEPVIARGIRSSSAERLIVRIAPSLDGDDRSGAGYVDPGSGALVFYLRDVALAVQLVAADATTTLQESNGREPTHDIVVHPRCRHTSDELSFYSWATDPRTEKIIHPPRLEDKDNHLIDALRYAVEEVRRSGSMMDVVE